VCHFAKRASLLRVRLQTRFRRTLCALAVSIEQVVIKETEVRGRPSDTCGSRWLADFWTNLAAHKREAGEHADRHFCFGAHP
jgi:hypothetical protein